MVTFTKDGTKVDVSFEHDEDGSWYCVVARHDTLMPINAFFIRPEECNTEDFYEVQEVAKVKVENL